MCIAVVGIEFRTDFDLVIVDLRTGVVIPTPLQSDSRLSLHEWKDVGRGRRSGVREVLHTQDRDYNQRREQHATYGNPVSASHEALGSSAALTRR